MRGAGGCETSESLTACTRSAPIARRTILSDEVPSVLVPILEEIVGMDATRIRAYFEAHGFSLEEWEKTRTDSISIRGTSQASAVA